MASLKDTKTNYHPDKPKRPRSSGSKMPPIEPDDKVTLACLAKLNLCGEYGIGLDRLASTAGYSYILSELGSNKPRISTAVTTLFSKFKRAGLITIELPEQVSIYAPGKAYITEAGRDRLVELREKMGIAKTELGSFHGVRVQLGGSFSKATLDDF